MIEIPTTITREQTRQVAAVFGWTGDDLNSIISITVDGSQMTVSYHNGFDRSPEFTAIVDVVDPKADDEH